MKISQERLKELLHYDPETGVFTWLPRPGDDRHINMWNTRYAGTIAGSPNNEGYIHITLSLIFKSKQKAHRLAWLYVHGEFPPDQIDHINRDKTDNSLANLRLADKFINAQNKPLFKGSKSGVTGVLWHKRIKKWQVSVRRNLVRGYYGQYTHLWAATHARRFGEIDIEAQIQS